MAEAAPRIWVLFGIPTCEEEFIARMCAEGGVRSDYLSKYDNPDLPDAERPGYFRLRWSQVVQQSIGEKLGALAATAEELGCRVTRRATIGDIRLASGNACVLVLVSHWKGPEFSNDDFLASFDAEFPGRIASATGPLADWIRSEINPRRQWLPFLRSTLSPREAVRRALAANIKDSERIERPETMAARRRDIFDAWMGDCVRPGNRLEMFDGLFGRDEIVSALRDFSGVVDLVSCTSTYLGDHIAARLNDRVRTVQFLTLQDPVDAALRLKYVLTLASQLPATELNYLSARMTVSHEYSEAVDEILRTKGVRHE